VKRPSRILRQGPRTIEIIGARSPGLRDFYHYMVGASWGRSLAILAGCFLAVNALFALIYMLTGGINNAAEGSFADAFFFSVQTLGTIGYGAMYPVSLAANLVVTVETMLGLMGLAITTGLVFAKFSRPTARIMFSKVALIATRDGVRTLMFRVANERSNSVVEATVKVSLLRSEVTREGESVRKMYEVPLVRNTSPAFILSWTVLHPVVPGSVLHGLTQEEMVKQDVQLFVSLTGLDETTSQTIHARHTYQVSDLVWDARFVDVITMHPDGRRVVDYGRFHETLPVDPPAAEAAPAPDVKAAG
jgi:inward rectifier potassium channel